MDLDTVKDAFDTLAANHPAARDELDSWRGALDHRPAGTMRQWFTDRHGQAVDTFQISRLNTDTPNVWMPRDRTINAAPTYVQLDGSRRAYKGMRVLATSTDTLVVTDDYQSVIYRTVR